MAAQQNFRSHTRWDPLYHFLILPILILNICVVFWWHIRHPAHAYIGAWAVLITIILLVLALKVRTYPLKVQDRIIRLEVQHRLAALASPAELVELDSLSMGQYVGLRFASNAELPELARRAVRENLTRKQIKEAVTSWRPDNDRI